MFRGRFAPSPTGDLHLGNARTALFAWLQARHAGGRFVMRVEDLDPGRARPEFVQTQLDDLRWLGLDWDEGPDVGGPYAPYLQSLRAELYARALDHLRRRGLLFECYCSRKEIAAAASAPHDVSEEGPVYPGTCSYLSEAERATRPSSSSAERMIVPEGEVTFEDGIAGRQRFEPLRETGAFVVRRKDGVAAYQLAVVVDDAAMGITHVLRGADLVSSTARQILLYHALDLEPPAWAHVPLMLGPDGERLSKRHGSVTLREIREAGVRAERVVGWLASTCGLAAQGVEMEAGELIRDFELSKIGRDPFVVARLPWDTAVGRASGG